MKLFGSIVILLLFYSITVMGTRILVSTDNDKISATNEEIEIIVAGSNMSHKNNSSTDYEYSSLTKTKFYLSGMSRNRRSTDSCSNETPSKRIDCGWPGMAQHVCTHRWCCFDDSLPGVPHCFINVWGGSQVNRYTHDEKCDFSKPHERTDCGFLTIGPMECEARGCCYDARVYGVVKLCFFSPPRPSGKCRSDDPNCKTPCTNDTWQCNNGLCIPTNYRCNDRNDCGDSSDEHNCTVQVTTSVEPTTTAKPTTTFKPTTTARTKTTTRPTTTVELATVRSTQRAPCPSDQWRCNNGRCILARFVCDWHNDCGDGSDEQKCLHGSCPTNEWRCNNGWCIDIRFRCDGLKNHCGDWSDEKHCPAMSHG